MSGNMTALIRSEMCGYRSLWLFVRGKRDGVSVDVRPVGYTKGTMGMPIAFLVACVVEAVAIHLLVPWPWMRNLLLLVSVYGFVPVLGILAGRIVHPHLLTPDRLTVRSGHQVVADVDRSAVVRCIRHRRFAHTSVTVEDGALYLPGPDGTNIDVVLDVPIEVRLPGFVEHRRSSAVISRLSLQVDNPDETANSLCSNSKGTGVL